MDVQRLIREIKVRSILWDVRSIDYRHRLITLQLWQEIADQLEIDVESCKRKWKNLRNFYHAEVRRMKQHDEDLKASGQYDPKMRTTRKWIYFEPMSFISVNKRTQYELAPSAPDASSGSLDNSMNGQMFQSSCDIKMEPTDHTRDEDDHHLEVDENEMLFKEFLLATPQATRRLSNGIPLAAVEENGAISAASAAYSSAGASTRGGVSAACNCTTRSGDQVHFLESLMRKEQPLIESTCEDMTRADTPSHLGDADYNFLVSFLPQMKKMSELQNLQFRAKMSNEFVRIMTPSSPANSSSGRGSDDNKYDNDRGRKNGERRAAKRVRI